MVSAGAQCWARRNHAHVPGLRASIVAGQGGVNDDNGTHHNLAQPAKTIPLLPTQTLWIEYILAVDLDRDGRV